MAKTPTLYILNKQQEVVANISNNGITANLSEDLLHQTLRSSSFSFKVPANEAKSEHLVAGNFVVFEDMDGEHQFFRILDHEIDKQNFAQVEVYAENVGIELLNSVLRPYTGETADVEVHLANMLQGTGWEVGNCDPTESMPVEFKDYKSIKEGLSALSDMFDGDLKFTVELVGSKVSARKVSFAQKMGQDTGKRFTYSKDIMGVKRVETMIKKDDFNGLYSGVLPIGKNGADGTPVTIRDEVFSIANGDPFNKPAGQDFVEHEEASAIWGIDGRRIEVHRVYPTNNPRNLGYMAWTDILNNMTSRVFYEFDLTLLESIPGYEHEAVRIGDTIRIIDNTFKPALQLEARIVELFTSFTDPSKNKAIVGDYDGKPVSLEKRFKELEAKVIQKEDTWDNGGVNGGSGGGTCVCEHECTCDLTNYVQKDELSLYDFKKNGNLVANIMKMEPSYWGTPNYGEKDGYNFDREKFEGQFVSNLTRNYMSTQGVVDYVSLGSETDPVYGDSLQYTLKGLSTRKAYLLEFDYFTDTADAYLYMNFDFDTNNNSGSLGVLPFFGAGNFVDSATVLGSVEPSVLHRTEPSLYKSGEWQTFRTVIYPGGLFERMDEIPQQSWATQRNNCFFGLDGEEPIHNDDMDMELRAFLCKRSAWGMPEKPSIQTFQKIRNLGVFEADVSQVGNTAGTGGSGNSGSYIPKVIDEMGDLLVSTDGGMMRVVQEGDATGYTLGSLEAYSVYANGVKLTSSATKKTNIKPFEGNALDIIESTNVYRYHYTADVDALNFDNEQVGLIAEASPKIIKGDSANSINQYLMASVMWASLQELSQQRKEDRKEIEELKEIIYHLASERCSK